MIEVLRMAWAKRCAITLFCIQMKTNPESLFQPPASPVTEPAQPSEAVDRRTLPATIADRLREMIIEGELAAGTRLNERALCDRLQVSRTPLREAFRLLSADGMVRMQIGSASCRERVCQYV